MLDKIISNIEIRSPNEVMKLDRLGVAFPTRLSFSRRLIRLMHRENWKIYKKTFNLNREGFGIATYEVATPSRFYTLICFSHYLSPENRTDRVIANQWDATFVLFDGVPNKSDIERLSKNVPKQESGRFQKTDLVISRANKSVRLFGEVTNSLSKGYQPDIDKVNSVGYLMRTTAVYANGKFGLCDRFQYLDRPELSHPFQVEMLTVYLIRLFTFDLIDHVAYQINKKDSVKLNKEIKRHLGIGNATGLGMAPFLISHPVLIHNWFYARELSLQKVRSVDEVKTEKLNHFIAVSKKAIQHVREWFVNDELQTKKTSILLKEMQEVLNWVNEKDFCDKYKPWNNLFSRSSSCLGLECQELLVSLLLEPYPEIIDEISEGLEDKTEELLNVNMTIGQIKDMIDRNYKWALDIDFSDPNQNYHFWYYSKEKLEPRRGIRDQDLGSEKEMKITVAKDIQLFRNIIDKLSNNESLATFVMRNNNFRDIASRVQIGSKYNFSEIRDNIISDSCKPVDILRCKLAYFGASKFDPKSDLWTRITMYQGAPLNDEIYNLDFDDWCFPVKPQ